MIKCPKCGKEYRDDAVFCTDCGIRLHGPYRRGIPQQRSLRPRRTL